MLNPNFLTQVFSATRVQEIRIHNLDQIWTNPNVGLKIQLENVQLKVKVEVGLKSENKCLTQHLGLSIF